MPGCAFLTLDNSDGFVIDDERAYPALAELGWKVEAVSWRRKSCDWRTFDAVVIRSTWDYIEDPDTFLAVLSEIERSGTHLFNPLELVRWNIRKTYLRDLAGKGVPVVPTIWRDKLVSEELPALIEKIGSDEAVIKPVIGLNARGIFRVSSQSARKASHELSTRYGGREFMIQPFLNHILSEGEFSLFYFNGELSHTILKTPKPNDFRVQEEHGGIIRTVEPRSALCEAGDKVMRALNSVPLYARADFVRANHDDGYWLIELELIEPSLYLRMDRNAPARFARALHERVRLA